MTYRVDATIGGQQVVLDSPAVLRALRKVLPDPLNEHYAVIGGRRFPPKQVISEVTGIDKADFTTHQARNILRRLGFAVGRRTPEAVSHKPNPDMEKWPKQGREAEMLRPYMGRWVAVRGSEVQVSAENPQEIVEWLRRHNQTTDGIFRVPLDRRESEILAAP